MRILHLTDTHFGARRRVRGAPSGWQRSHDHLASARAAFDLADSVDLIVHTGDVFDRSRPPRRAVAQAADLLAQVARHTPVVVLAGNHDRRGLKATLPVTTPGLHIVDHAQRICVAGIALAAVPFLADADGWAAAASHATGPGVDLLLCHQAFDGCTVPGFRFAVDRQPDTIGARHMPAGVTTVLCGHIHPRQSLRVGAATVVMPGSTERTSFAEAGQAKGAAIWDLDGDVRWRFVDLPARPMATVRIAADLEHVQPGTLVRVPRGPQQDALDAAVRARGGWACGPPPGLPPPLPRPPRRQLGLFARG